MLSYYLTAAIAFTLGFLAAAMFLSARHSQASRDRAWLAEAIRRFATNCRSRPHREGSTEQFLVERKELEGLEEAASEKAAE
jgi:hypothetical protein